ncbi:MAG TPA: PAS domain-containing protein, partial [Desulfosarcina sp.]|nr:PAS domain-containing protein [Desulfosarcina sp.]
MRNLGNLVTESMLADVIDNLTGAILLVNRDRRVILANKMTEKMTGQPQTALQGRRGGEVLGCVNAARSPGGCGFDARCTFCGIKRMVEETFAHKAANTFLSAEVASTLFGRRDLRVSTKYLIVDNAEAVLISMEDVTREKTEERLRMENAQLVAAMETAGAVCHELNQP